MTVPQTKYRIAASSLFFIQGFTVTSWASRLPDIKSNLALSDGTLGMLLLAPPAGQLAAMSLSGHLVRRFGSFRIARIAALLLPCWLPVVGMVSTNHILALFLFIFGMATNLSNIAANTQGVSVEQLYGKSIMSFFHGIWSLGGACAILLSSLCSMLGVSPLGSFLCSTAVSLLIYLPNFRNLLRQDCKVQNEKQEETPVLNLLKDSYLWILGLISLGCMGCEGIMNNWTSIYFQKYIIDKAQFVRIGFLAYMVAITLCRFTADLFVRKWGAKSLIGTAGCLVMAGIALMTSFPNPLPATLGCALVGLGTSAIVPVCFGLAGKHGQVPVATAITMVATISFLGFLLMPALVGMVSEWTGLRMTLFLAGLSSFILIQLIHFTKGKEKGR